MADKGHQSANERKNGRNGRPGNDAENRHRQRAARKEARLGSRLNWSMTAFVGGTAACRPWPQAGRRQGK